MTVDDEAVVGMATDTDANCMTIGGPADGGLVAASFENGAVVAWDIADPERPRLLGGDIFVTRVTEIAINPRRRQLAFGGHRGPVVVWDFESGARHMLSPDLPGVVTLAYSRDGGALTAFVQSGFSDDERSSRVIVWNLESLQVRSEWVMAKDNTFTVSLTGGVLSKSEITISPDGTAFAIADDETVALWDCESQALLGALRLAERPDILMFVAEGDALSQRHRRLSGVFAS